MGVEAVDDRLVERRLLLKRAFSRVRLFEIGRELGIPYFNQFLSGWEVDPDEAALQIASALTDHQLRKLFKEHKPRSWVTFWGKHYTLERGRLRLSGRWRTLQTNLREAREKFGNPLLAVLKTFLKHGGVCSLHDLKDELGA